MLGKRVLIKETCIKDLFNKKNLIKGFFFFYYIPLKKKKRKEPEVLLTELIQVKRTLITSFHIFLYFILTFCKAYKTVLAVYLKFIKSNNEIT